MLTTWLLPNYSEHTRAIMCVHLHGTHDLIRSGFYSDVQNLKASELEASNLRILRGLLAGVMALHQVSLCY